MGEGESLNEMVRSAGAYVDPGIATMTSNALMMSGEPRQRLRRRDRTPPDPDRCRPRPGSPARLSPATARARWPRRRTCARTEPQLAALLQSAASGQPAAGAVPRGAARWARDDDVRSRPRSPAGRGAAVERPADDPRPGRQSLAADRDPGRGGRARRGVGDHRGDATERPLRPGGARRCRHAGGDGAARAARGCCAQCQQCGRDHAVVGRGLWRGARQPVVRHRRARERDPACSPCRPSRSTPTSPRRRSAACCCSATSA